MALISLSALAQTQPNRMIVMKKPNLHKGFLVERIDSVFFTTVEGRVAADVTFLKYNNGSSGDTIWVNVKRTPECKLFQLNVIPKVVANNITSDEIAERYFERIGGTSYGEDFENGQITGFDKPFPANAEYTILTLGYDKYGIACSMSKADFKTPAKPLIGNPQVDCEILNVGTDRFTMKFTPNNDVKGYAFCSFEKGTAIQQFEQWGAMFGYTTFGDMIKGFCQKEYNFEHTNEWLKMTPGTDYEVVVQAWDNDGTYAEPQFFYVTTKKLGGNGLATVTIEIKDFKMEEEDLYLQRVIYTPNDQASLHRDIIIEKEAYEKPDMGETGVIAMLKTDNPNDPNWNQYGVDDAYWIVKPSTGYYACSIAKNAKDEWGEFVKKAFTTPAGTTPGAPVGKFGKRINFGVTNGVAKFDMGKIRKDKTSIKLEQK